MKKYALVFLLCLAPYIAGCPPATDPEKGALRVFNESSHDITALFAGPSAGILGGNLLTTPLIAGFNRTLGGIPPETEYDFEAEFGERGGAKLFRVVFAAGETREWRLTGADIINEDGVPQDILDKEDAVFDLINAERRAGGVDSLAMRRDLRQLARGHSQDMIDRNFFSSENPDGDDLFARLDAAEIPYRTAGENIASNSGFGEDTVQQAVDEWLAGEDNVLNILDPVFTDTAIGVATDGDGTFVYTQIFTSGEEAKTTVLVRTAGAR